MIEEETQNRTAELDFTADPSRIEQLNVIPVHHNPLDRPLPGQDFCVVNSSEAAFESDNFNYVANDRSRLSGMRPIMGMQ